MYSIKASTAKLLEPLSKVAGIVERRHTLPILANVLIESNAEESRFIATDLEVQITARAPLPGNGRITIAAKKLSDILRALSSDAETTLDAKDSKMIVKSAKSRFSLQTLAADDFPKIAPSAGQSREVKLKQKDFRKLLNRAEFSMAVQDIRYYLNGVLLSLDGKQIRVVATDGHRLSYASMLTEEVQAPTQVIIPRKTVLELTKLMSDSDDPITITLSPNQVKFVFGALEIISKVVEGNFPDYQKVIPGGERTVVELDRVPLLQSLQRAAILSSEKIRGVRLVFTQDQLAIICSNSEHEEAEENLTIAYAGKPLDMGFNIAYLLDVLNHLGDEKVRLTLGEANGSAVFEILGEEEFKYVVMPMRI
jgi:DNA polymerase III subunit beta